MIKYVEIRDASREIIGIVDTAKSIIWHAVWFGVGDFEIYAPATAANLALLQVNNYVTRNDTIDVGIIETINIADSIQDGAMITASGRFAKSILDRRHIYKLSGNTNTATILKGNVEIAVRQVIKDNAISCSFDSSRNIAELGLGALANIPAVIVDENGKAAEKQVSFDNLLTYTDGVLQEYGLSAYIQINFNAAKKLLYFVKQGTDRSVDNTNELDPVIFSKDFDNLISSEYLYDTQTEKNTALIGGEGEGLDRYYTLLKSSKKGLARRETWVNASSLSKKYKDDQDQEQTYTDAQYSAMLISQGKQTLAPLIITETFNGSLDVTNGNYRLNRDFELGDIVTVEEKSINKYINVRIAETTEVQDENGYTVDAKYI